MIDLQPRNSLNSSTLASYKSYILAWTGFRVGSVQEQRGQAINISNIVGQPFSSHPGLLTCCFTDGSVTALSETIDVKTMLSLATSQNGDIAARDP